MSDKSAIDWTDATWNPVVGCAKVSAGCQECYAIRVAHRLGNVFAQESYQGLVDVRPDGSLNWTGEVRCLPERLDWPLKWRKPRRIFVTSMGDLFHESVPDEFIARVFRTMARAPQHVYQVLTKRPERMLAWMARCANSGHGWVTHNGDHPEGAYRGTGVVVGYAGQWPPGSVWLGVSVENQAAADERIPLLLQTPAAVRCLSCEPLLGPVELHDVLPGIDWVIVGGESGGPPERWLVERCTCRANPSARGYLAARGALCTACHGTGWRPRPEALEWVCSLRDQCQRAGVPFFFEGWGGPRHSSGGDLLDGREWREFPTAERRA